MSRALNLPMSVTKAVAGTYRAGVDRLLNVAALVSACALTVGLAASPASASPDKRPCVTKPEYRQIKKGMTLVRVHDIFDTKGTILFQNPGAVTNGAREYRSCRKSGLGAKVQIQYNNYATNGGPFRVVNIDSY